VVLILQRHYNICQILGEGVNQNNLRVVRLDKVIISRRKRRIRRGRFAHGSHIVRAEEKACDKQELEGDRVVEVASCGIGAD
jgi:hypothetical protein